MSPEIFGEKIEALKSGMDYAVAKNRIISSNIANIETPGYKRFKVLLDEKLGGASGHNHIELAQTHKGHIPGKAGSSVDSFKIVREEGIVQRVDGNNVDIDKELAEMSANAIYFTSLTSFLAKNFAGLRSIISEGRR